MQPKQNIASYEGERYYFDVILQHKPHQQTSTFEIRATCVDTGANAVVTNVAEIRELFADEIKNYSINVSESVWKLSTNGSQELLAKSAILFSNDNQLSKFEDAMNDDRSDGHWVNEDDFITDELMFDEFEDGDDTFDEEESFTDEF